MFETCKKCGMPNTRPGSVFTDGVCQPCINFANRKAINWQKRSQMLSEILNNARKHGAQYDCVCPVSGGKDSLTIVAGLVERGAVPLLVTVTDEFTHTQAGLHNVKNIAERFDVDHIVFRHAPGEFKHNTWEDFKRELHPLKWIEEKIYKTPIQIARAMGIPTVFFGENSGYEYGCDTELSVIHPLSDDMTHVYYYFAFTPYCEESSLHIARSHGFKDLTDFAEWPRQGNIEQFTQIDSIGYIIQLWTKFPKYGFQRVADMTSRMVRRGRMTLEKATEFVKNEDWRCDPAAKADFCKTINITEKCFDEIVDKHANRDILVKDAVGNWRRKDLM